eukprot:jgi/Botrbrau1/15875/Bobra.40_1s0059.1
MPLQGELEGIAEDSRQLKKLAEKKGWCLPGHGNYAVTVETYEFCPSDRQYHFIDHYDQMGPAVVKILKWDEVDEAFKTPEPAPEEHGEALESKVERLKRDLAAARAATLSMSDDQRTDHVNVILCLSDHLVKAERFPAGTSAGSLFSMYQGKVSGPGDCRVKVNAEWVTPDTLLVDGDLIEVSCGTVVAPPVLPSSLSSQEGDLMCV